MRAVSPSLRHLTIVVAPDNAPEIGGAMDGSIDEDAADPPLRGRSPLRTLTTMRCQQSRLLPDGAGQYGTLTFVASADGGIWTYTLNNANADVQALLKDATLTEEFTFTAEGAAPHHGDHHD